LRQHIEWFINDAVEVQWKIYWLLKNEKEKCCEKLFSAVRKNKKARLFSRALLYEWVSKYRETKFPYTILKINFSI
jgi:hypothetical protein